MLVEYREANDDCNVRQDYVIDEVRLGIWVSTQRRQYKLRQDGKHSCITQGRIDQLDDIEFEWYVGSGTTKYHDLWNEYLRLLDEYKEREGDYNVPYAHVTTCKVNLGNWVAKMKVEYRNYQEGKHSRLTDARFAMLEERGLFASKKRSRKATGKAATKK